MKCIPLLPILLIARLMKRPVPVPWSWNQFFRKNTCRTCRYGHVHSCCTEPFQPARTVPGGTASWRSGFRTTGASGDWTFRHIRSTAGIFSSIQSRDIGTNSERIHSWWCYPNRI